MTPGCARARPAAAAAARLDAVLEGAARRGAPLLGGCLPAGWPPALAGGAAAWRALAASADLAEIALPAAAPHLDGEVLSRAHRETLTAGYRHEDTLALITLLSATVPVLVVAYWETIAAAGPGEMALGLARAGAAAAVLPDLPAGPAADAWSRAARGCGLHTILLTAPDGSPSPQAGTGSGAVYLPAAAGRTGTPGGPGPGLAGRVRRARELTGLPVLTGIGITAPQHAAQAARSRPDAVIAGTAFTRAARSARPAEAVSRLAGEFRAALAGWRPPA